MSQRFRAPSTVAVLAVSTIAATILSIFIGARPTGFITVLHSLGGTPDDPSLHTILWSYRIPRTLAATACGIALAVAGGPAQTWTRNTIADPGIIGITFGAAFAVALGVTLGIDSSTGRLVLAVLGATATAALTLFLVRNADDNLALILVGTGVSASLSAFTTILALQTSRTLEILRHWTIGSTSGTTGGDLGVLSVGLVVGLLITAQVARPMDLIAMGDSVSTTLGSDPRRTRFLAATAIVILCAGATAAVGPVAFVGLAGPHIARSLVGPSLTVCLPVAALVGALLTLGADMAGRVLLRPGEVEFSVILAFIGAPLLIAVVRRGKLETL